MTEIKSVPGTGKVEIADDVIAVIAGTTAMEVEGVAGMGQNPGGIVNRLGHKNPAKGVGIELDGLEVALVLNISVKFGHKILETSAEVQRRVKSAVETMTGLSVRDIRVNVTNVTAGREPAK